jgi:hypothetical protein
VILLGTVMPAAAKLICPPGRFTIDTSGASPRLDGSELVLGQGTVRLAETCRSASAGRYLARSDRWLLRVVARWKHCHGRTMVMRARFDPTDVAYCARLSGVIRSGSGRRTRFVASRIPECGNDLREPGEQCDGQDGTFFGMDCCAADCRVKPDCPVVCDLRRGFPCERAEQTCVTTCGFGGVCSDRAEVDCGTTPVCDCNHEVTYANRCAAYDAGAGVAQDGPCPP